MAQVIANGTRVKLTDEMGDSYYGRVIGWDSNVDHYIVDYPESANPYRTDLWPVGAVEIAG